MDIKTHGKMTRRYASPNERRTISREDLGWYNNVAIGAIYTFTGISFDQVQTPEFYYDALAKVILEHPFLTVVVKDKHTDKAYYEHVQSVHLQHHITIVNDENLDSVTAEKGLDSDKARIERLLPSLVDYAYPDGRPPWSMTVLPLKSSTANSTIRCFICFAFSHTLGDGMNGLTFHQDLLQGLRNRPAVSTSQQPQALIKIPSSTTLDEPFDTPQRLPISWSFLLGPLLAVLLPKWLAAWIGVRASTSTVELGMWFGVPMFHNKPDEDKDLKEKQNDTTYTDKTQMRLINIPAEQVSRALTASRQHNAKLTGTLHQIIVHALSRSLPTHTNGKSLSNNKPSSTDEKATTTTTTTPDKATSTAITRFASQTAINMRPTLGIPNRTMGLFVNGCFLYSPRTPPNAPPPTSGPLNDEEWRAATLATHTLAISAATLSDQPIGLLRYAPSIRSWLSSKMGQNRDCSYEVSNLLAFEPVRSNSYFPKGVDTLDKIDIDWICFAQPRNPTSSPFVFDVVSLKGGEMCITLVWQAGALRDVVEGGLEGEKVLIERVCEEIRREFGMFGGGGRV